MSGRVHTGPGERRLREAAAVATRASGRPLEPDVRRTMEARFGYSFARVRVHDDARAAAAADSIDGEAFTVGQDIAFGAGRYAPSTAAGRELLAHELAHVGQQARTGRKAVQRQKKGGAAPAATTLEDLAEADRRRIQAVTTMPVEVPNLADLFSTEGGKVGDSLARVGHGRLRRLRRQEPLPRPPECRRRAHSR